MMFKTLVALLPVAMMAQSDYLDATPATVYEAAEMTPQNMDFDKTNNMFVAHSGWYKDRLVHYYKFRMFTPSTYEGLIFPGNSSSVVPLQKIFMVTTDGGFEGVVGMPIIEFHTMDGLTYSDFMSVTFVEAPAGYEADTFKSKGDIMESGAAMTDSGIVLNIPVVPTGATLQDPMKKGTAKAPIDPVPVFYRGVEVWTYVFEVTDSLAAAFFADTRTSATAVGRQSELTTGGELTTGFEIPVVTFAGATVVSAIPIWHVNQFSNGVTEGNGGGPNPAGMRNIIDMDRPDPGYSPLWQVFWATEMPINYSADELSNSAMATSANGFTFNPTPMFVNCPDIGLIGTEVNPLKAESFMTMIDMSKESNIIIGSAMSLIMQGGKTVKFMAGETVIATTETNMMGGYEYTLMSADIPEGTTEITLVKADDGSTIRSIMVKEGGSTETMGDDDESSASFIPYVGAVAVSVFATLLF